MRSPLCLWVAQSNSVAGIMPAEWHASVTCSVACFSHCGCQALPSTMTENPGSLGDIE